METMPTTFSSSTTGRWFDGRNVIRLVQWRERLQPFEIRQNLRRHDGWRRVLGASMHHAMPHAHYARAALHESEPVSQRVQRAVGVPHLGAKVVIHQRCPSPPFAEIRGAVPMASI